MIRSVFGLITTSMVLSTQPLLAANMEQCLSKPLSEFSQELQEIVNADQADRRQRPIDWSQVTPRDRARRERVRQIFEQGGLISARDFTAAALVFQHGDFPKHYYQAYVWAKRAVELGLDSQRLLMASAIDRYLVSIGHKQLYGTQAFRSGEGDCHCLQPVEASFPKSRRGGDAYWSIPKAFKMLAHFNQGKKCGGPKVCSTPLLPTPEGFLQGIW